MGCLFQTIGILIKSIHSISKHVHVPVIFPEVNHVLIGVTKHTHQHQNRFRKKRHPAFIDGCVC